MENFLFVGYTVKVSIVSWFKKITTKQKGEKDNRRISVLPHKTSVQDLDLSSLRSEQRDLAQSLGKMIEDAEKALNGIAVILKENKPHDKHALAHIRERQSKIRIAILRLETALQRRQDLERELSEWVRPHVSGQHDQARADIKTELLRSELAIRDLLEGKKKHVERFLVEDKEISEPVSAKPEKTEDAAVVVENQTIKKTPSLRVSHEHANHLEPQAANLVRSIRELSHELSKHEQAPNKDVKEMASIAHQIRNLHAILRKVDKKFGKVRDRIEITDGFRHVFQQH